MVRKVIFKLNDGEYAVDSDNSRLVLFWKEEEDEETDESYLRYKYEGDKLLMEGDGMMGNYFWGNRFSVEYINAKAFSDYYKKGLLGEVLVKDFAEMHLELIREEKLIE